jgi:crotonobetainyl-CoA:carnitine CoA-transferase CaiB-like acyl-CoA transferase
VGLLTGQKMLDLSRLLPGPYGSLLLADLGMEILKIEDLEMGDYIRKMGPIRQEDSAYFLAVNRNKKSMTLNLKIREGKEIFFKLIDTYDVILESFRPGVMDDWGIGYEKLAEVNPGLIFASITGYGQFGPMSRSRMPDYDNITQARSGIQYTTGEVMPEGKSYDECPWAVPTKAGPWIGWVQPGTFMAVGILAALYWRGMTGEGQALDVATAEAYASFDDYATSWYQGCGSISERFGNLTTAAWLYCFAPTKDGAVFLGGIRLEMWKAFATW